MAKRKPSSQFELRFERRDVFPEEIAFYALADAVEAIQRLAAGDVPESEVERLAIFLLDIGRGSAAFRLVTSDPDLARTNLGAVARVLERNELDETTAFVVRPIHELSRVAKKYESPIVLTGTLAPSEAILRIVPESYTLLEQSALAGGNATTAAFVARVGGATEPKCVLRIPDHRRVLFCQLESQELARRLARHLYQWVLVGGEATWLRQSQRIIRLRVRFYRPFPKGTVTEGFRAMREVAGDAWNRIDDPAGFLTEMTGD